MFALAPSPLPPGQTIIHKYSVQCAPYNATGLLIFPMLATSLGARFGGCELFAVCSHRYRYIRRQCDGNGNDNGNGNSSDDTYRHIAVAVIAVSLLPDPATPQRPLCVFTNNACSAFASASASLLPSLCLFVHSFARWFACCFVRRRAFVASLCHCLCRCRCHWLTGSGCTRAGAVGSAERDTRTYVQAGWQATAIQANFSKLVEFHCTLRRVCTA